MAIDFKEIVDSSIPFVQAELIKAPSLTGRIKQEFNCLLIGQMTTQGNATPNEVIQIITEDEAKGKFGRDSMLAHAAKAWFKINKGVNLKVYPMVDASTTTKATATLTITGTATANGTFAFYVNGRGYRVSTALGDTPDIIATNLVTAISADLNSQVLATNLLGVLTVTAVHGGTYGNTIKVKVNYNADDLFPSGVDATVVNMNGGSGDPDLENEGVISHLEENQYNLIAMPYTDNANLTLVDIACTDNFKATEMLDGFCVVGVNDTVSNLISKSAILNTPFITILDNYSVFSTGFEQAAATIATIADIAQTNPGSSYLNRELLGLLPLVQRLRAERRVLAYGGIATSKVQGTKIQIERTVTTFQKDSNGIPQEPDDTDLRVFLTISYVRFTFIIRMSQYQGWKLGNDEDNFGLGVQVMTPNYYKQLLILNYDQLVTDAVCEDMEAFETALELVPPQKVGNRIDSQFPINVINVVLQQAMQIKYTV